MKILLISENRYKAPLMPYPLGVAYLAGNIDKKKHIVKVLDLMFEEDFKQSVDTAVKDFRPDIIGLSIRNLNPNGTSILPDIVEIIKICRKSSQTLIVLGGTGFSMMPKEVFQQMDADFGVIGEGVVPFNLLIEKIENRHSFSKIPGLIWRARNSIYINKPTNVDHPDDFLLPDRFAFDYEDYVQKGLFTGNVLVKRGNPFENLWDDTPRGEGKKLRLRTPKCVADELELLNKDLGFSTATLVASKINYPQEYAESLCKEILTRKLSLLWFGDLHPAFSSPESFSLMKQAGCTMTYIDVGPCSNMMLRKMGANFTLDHIRKCCADLHSVDLDFGFLAFLGGPGETRETVEECLALIDEVDPAMVTVTIGMGIFPSTPLAEIAKQEGLISSNDQDLHDIYNSVKYIDNSVQGWITDRISQAAQEREGFMC